KATVGYCVRLSESAPDRPVKEVLRVLDDEALLTDNLLRLTRWMADYYLCGWGQVLNAVIPAGAREKAGTKAAAYLEAVPETDVRTPPPKLSPKETAALEHLRSAGRALEARQLARLAKCGPAPLEALVEKGYARRVVKRVDRFADTSEEAQVSDEPI